MGLYFEGLELALEGGWVGAEALSSLVHRLLTERLVNKYNLLDGYYMVEWFDLVLHI